jgi:tetratricopeptide (TPR) repeat protein
LQQSRSDAAIECLRTALRVAPDYADAMFNLALLLQRTNQYAEAAGYWRRYLGNDCQSTSDCRCAAEMVAEWLPI